MDNNNKNDDVKKPYEYDECTLRAICSTSQPLSDIHEVILLHLKELSFYLLELKTMGATNELMRQCLLDALSIILTNVQLKEEQYAELILSLDKNISETKKKYFELCKEQDKAPHFLKTCFKHKKDLSLAKGIKKGEKYIQEKNSVLTHSQKNLFDITLMILKSTYIRAFELKSLGEDPHDICSALLLMLNSMNFLDTPAEKIKETIEENSTIFYELLNRLIVKKEELYGKMDEHETSFSTIPGRKAIMVVGCNIKELELVLQATEGKDIDVYTHGLDMLMAHTFPKLREYKHLVGHFGQCRDNALMDFVTFPGSILMTRHAVQKSEYIYKGRLFTTDLLAQRGVTKIYNNDYQPLIDAALSAKGFRKGQKRPPMKIGFNEEALTAKVNEVLDKMEDGEIKQLYIVGLLNYERVHKEYFDKFFKLLPKDCFVFSLAYNKSGKNIVHLDSIFDYTVICKILQTLSKRRPIKEIDMSVFLTNCNRHTVASTINLKKLGVKNIFMSKCHPNLANPTLIKTMKDTFGINEFFDPKEDIEKTQAG